eukprot:435330-Alexandrium_andersonii.AAC.1
MPATPEAGLFLPGCVLVPAGDHNRLGDYCLVVHLCWCTASGGDMLVASWARPRARWLLQ